MNARVLLLIQLAATCLILAWVPSNVVKTAALLVVWTLTFSTITWPEIALYFTACALFSGMDIAATRQGIFAFNHPDFMGLPWYEFFMWGFYLLHTRRMIGGSAPTYHSGFVWVTAILFSLCFSLIVDPRLLLAVSTALLLIALAAYHDKLDLAYVVYMAALGTVIEFTGVGSGQWRYPESDIGAVPLWSIPMWGGIGLFLRRLALPFLSRSGIPAHAR